MTDKKIDSIKHNKETRVHIPSKEEAGYEDANIKVQSGKKIIEIPKNPVVHRGQDPELFWLNKYGNDDRDDLLRVDIRSLYRHEHIAPETLIKQLYKITETQNPQLDLFSINELFGNALEKDELEKVGEYYHHQDGWTNRLIQGDSHLVMASLLEREGMAGQVQTIFFDPPYGIKYGGNWQIKLNNRDVKDGNDEALTGEPEQIKAFRDTWELGIHSYLSYLRDRLLIAKELLTESGSCFVQIGDENMHLVRCILDEVFGSENFVGIITFQTAANQNANIIQRLFDHIIWYSKTTKPKIRDLFRERTDIEMQKVFSRKDENGNLYKADEIKNLTDEQIERLKVIDRITKDGKNAKLFNADYPVTKLHNVWIDTVFGHAKQFEKVYVVQTNKKVIERCLLMTTDPGDLVLDPTCGSGTTAFVAEQWGRRWITIDTSRIAINIAKQRLMTAVLPYYKLYDERTEDIRQGFIYKTVPHITLKSLANDEPPATETLYDQPEKDNKKLRVSGPFTVETLQNFEPISPEELDDEVRVNEEEGAFEEVIKQHLISAGVKNGRKDEHVVFTRIELLSHSYLHAEGFYQTAKGEAKAYFHIGPKFGTVSKKSVSEAVKECQSRGDASYVGCSWF